MRHSDIIVKPKKLALSILALKWTEISTHITKIQIKSEGNTSTLFSQIVIQFIQFRHRNPPKISPTTSQPRKFTRKRSRTLQHIPTNLLSQPYLPSKSSGSLPTYLRKLIRKQTLDPPRALSLIPSFRHSPLDCGAHTHRVIIGAWPPAVAYLHHRLIRPDNGAQRRADALLLHIIYIYCARSSLSREETDSFTKRNYLFTPFFFRVPRLFNDILGPRVSVTRAQWLW